MKMICPKRKECKYPQKKYCYAKKPHVKDSACNESLGGCPECVPYHQKPKSMFAGLRKGDRIEIEFKYDKIVLAYYHSQSEEIMYTMHYRNATQDTIVRFKNEVKSIKKLSVKRW